MSRRPRESESESEAEAEAPLRLDEPLAEEGLQDIDFDFDDPQERHAPSILGLLRKHPLADVAPRPALAALADLLAGDPRSVGTVVGSGGGDDLGRCVHEERVRDEDRDEAPRAKKARVAVSCASFHDDEFARASRDALDLGGGATLLALDPGQFAAAVARVGALAEET